MSVHASQVPPILLITGAHPKLYNHDLAPAAPEARTWGVFSLFAMWMSDVHSVGGYTFAASLFFLGLTGWQVLISMVVGIVAVYFLMNLIGRPSQRYGIPYPVVARISFGVMGANLAAVVRGVVGIVWYGVQTYFASKAVQVLVVTMVPSAAAWTHGNLLGRNHRSARVAARREHDEPEAARGGIAREIPRGGEHTVRSDGEHAARQGRIQERRDGAAVVGGADAEVHRRARKARGHHRLICGAGDLRRHRIDRAGDRRREERRPVGAVVVLTEGANSLGDLGLAELGHHPVGRAFARSVAGGAERRAREDWLAVERGDGGLPNVIRWRV